MKKKITITIICAVLSCVCLIGTTFAWLTATTPTITNTFTVGNIQITLVETAGTGDATSRSFKMIPGATIDKDPIVTVKPGSEACWLFVKIEETNNTFSDGTKKFVLYDTAEGWEQLVVDGTPVDGVYYRKVGTVGTTVASDTPFSVLRNDKITINKDATAYDLNNATGEKAPKLSFTAYAIQQSGFDAAGKSDDQNAADAWKALNS